MKLKWYQKNSGKTIEENAKELNLPKSTYNNYLRETREPDIETLCKLADYFKTSVDELLGHKTNSYELETISFEDRQAINTFLGLNDLKRAYIRGEINTIAKI